MDEALKKQMDAQNVILEKIYVSTEKTRKYFMWTLITSLVMFVLPLVFLAVALPSLIAGYTELLTF